MTSLNKLNRAIDSLKRIAISNSSDEINRYKLKITPCLKITELVCKSNEKSSLLPFAITSLIELFEDADSDARLVIDESLNKIIRSSIDNSNHVAKILIALLKIFGKNTNERSSKAALWRFAKLAHHIRPQKGKLYVKTLIPMIVKLANRKEDTIHETLADSLPSILKHIGLFTSDYDIRTLLKAFLRNLNSDSIEIRRAAAFCLITICEFSRKPQFFFSHLISILLDSLSHSQQLGDVNKVYIQGCLSSIRQVLPHFHQLLTCNDALVEKLLQIYEQCLYFAKFRDHNVVTAALETLHQLLQQPNSQFIGRLTTAGGFSKSVTCEQNPMGSSQSLSVQSEVISISSTIAQTEDGIFSSEQLSKKQTFFRSGSSSSLNLNEARQERTEKWLHDQTDEDNENVSSSLLNIDASHFANSDDEKTPSEVDLSLSSIRALSVENIQKISNRDEEAMCGRSKLKSQSVKSITTLSTVSGSVNIVSLEVDIGDLIDDNEIPLNYCSRFLIWMFLLENPGQPTKPVRVSVMSLALSCLSQLFKIYPAGGLLSVERSTSLYKNYSNILEAVLIHASHEDQLIRGYVRIVVGNFLNTSLIEDDYFLTKNETYLLNEKLLKDAISILLLGLEDESSICVKHSLHGISLCLESLLLTPMIKLVVPIFDVIFTLIDNPYWLIKIKILEIVGNLPYEILYYIGEDNSTIQDRILEKVIVTLLTDPDGRVRTIASRSLSEFIKNAYYPLDHQFEPVVITYTKKLNSKLSTCYSPKNTGTEIIPGKGHLSREELSLARIVQRISEMLVDTSSRNTAAGCCEVLSVLAAEYRPVKYPFGWQCYYYDKFVDNISGYCPTLLFNNLLSLMTRTVLIGNFDIHLSMLRTTSELFIALCKFNLLVKKKSSVIVQDGLWYFLMDQKLIQLAELFLKHLTRLASIFNDTVTNVAVRPQVLSTVTATVDLPLPIDQPLPLKLSSHDDRLLFIPSEKKLFFKKEDRSRTFFQYNHLPLYMKLKEALKSAYNNYEVTLIPDSSEKFVFFLKTVLDVLGVVLEFTTVSEIDLLCKNLLRFLHNFIVFLPIESVHCVKQLLKSVFGTNMIADYLGSLSHYNNDADSDDFADLDGFFDSCFQQPYREITRLMSSGLKTNRNEFYKERNILNEDFGYLSIKNPKRNVNVNTLPSYIKLFEPNVIQSLRHYTVTSDTTFQAEVLNLLSELIQLKVNYYLLDSEQVFIKFVLSQFQLIEDEQLLFIDKLLPAMFRFLIHLASEKHSNPVITVPKVIQLCDSLIASVETCSHTVLAIKPIVYHVFLNSSVIMDTNYAKELETQRDVLFAMLLKLMHIPCTMKMLTVILSSKEGEMKLKKSNQVVDTFITLLEQCKIVIEHEETRADVLNLLLNLHPSSLNEQRILNTIFSICHVNKSKKPVFWVPFLIPLLLVVLIKCDEPELLSAISQLLSHPIFLNNDDSDPFSVHSVQKIGISPARAFSQFLCENMKLILEDINDTKMYKSPYYDSTSQKTKLLSDFIAILSYIIKSGRFVYLKNELILNVEFETDHEEVFLHEINRVSGHLLATCPPVILRWYELVLRLKNLDWYFGQSDTALNIRRSMENTCETENLCLSNEAVKLGLFLLVCEHQNEFINNSEILRDVIQNNLKLLLDTVREPVVEKLLLNIQNSEIASRIFVDAIKNIFNDVVKYNNRLKKVFQSLKYCHVKSAGQIMLLCCRSDILNTAVPVSDSAFDLANQQVHYLLNIEEKEDFEFQLKDVDVKSLISEIKQTHSPKIRSIFIPLCQLAVKWYGIPIVPMSNDRHLNFNKIRCTVTDKMWFFNLVKHKCCKENETRYYAMAQLLGCLPLQDIFSIMRSQHFNNKILRYTFLLGTQLNSQWEAEFGKKEVEFSSLYLASRLAILRHIEHIKSLLPKIHQVYIPLKRETSENEMQYRQRMDSFFSDKIFINTVYCLMPAINEYLSSMKLLPHIELQVVVAANSFQNLAHFAVLCLETVHWLIKNDRHWSKTTVIDALKCCCSILKVKEIMETLTSSQIGSAISVLYSLVENCTGDTIKYSTFPIEITDNDPSCIYHSTHLISTLLEYFITKVPKASHSFESIIHFSKTLLMILSQSLFVYDYVRIPLEIWKHISKDEIIVKSSSVTLNTISENFLQDSDILQNFVSRIMFIGWNCRMQFEECWMSFLIALNLLPEHESSEEETEALSQVHMVTISAVTSLLVQTMYHPKPGNKTAPVVFHVSRNSFCFDYSKWKQKFEFLNNLFMTKAEICDENVLCLFKNININIERLHDNDVYNFNQISVEYLTLCCTNNLNIEDVNESSKHRKNLMILYQQRRNTVKKIGIDTSSCVYFLMDFYSRWLHNLSDHSVQILLEIVNSLLVISDLFTDMAQYAWLLESGLMLWKKCIKECGISSYLIVLICKATAVFHYADSDSKKLVLKILKLGLDHESVIVQTSTLYGLLYLLESIFKRNNLNPDEVIGIFENEIQSLAVFYVMENLDVESIEIYEEDMVNSLISVAYCLVENNSCGENTEIIIDRLLKLSVRACKLKCWKIYVTVIQSLYNLIIMENSTIKKFDSEVRQLVKEILSTLECTSAVAFLSLQMLAALMYASENLEDTRSESPNEIFDTEKLIVKMDKISVFFERMKKSSKVEAQLICSILPQILNDFFSASEILNKIILEFLSPQQPYPELLAEVVFKVFQNAIRQSQIMLIQDWVLSLLNNFSNYSTPRAIFYLTCFFISASENVWLTALFPSVNLCRSNLIDYDDRKLFCLSATCFYSQLKDDAQKKKFISTFRAAEKKHPESPFSEVLAVL